MGASAALWPATIVIYNKIHWSPCSRLPWKFFIMLSRKYKIPLSETGQPRARGAAADQRCARGMLQKQVVAVHSSSRSSSGNILKLKPTNLISPAQKHKARHHIFCHSTWPTATNPHMHNTTPEWVGSAPASVRPRLNCYCSRLTAKGWLYIYSPLW